MDHSDVCITSEIDDKLSAEKSNPRQNVSFTFSKRISKQLQGNKLGEDDREMIVSMEDREIRRAFTKEEKKKLVIPNPTKSTSKLKDKKDDKTNTLEEMAIKEVLKESAEKNEKWAKREFSNFTVTIPAILQNKSSNIRDQNIDFSSYPDSATSKDLEDVPVEEFASAYFRGLGCDPVGLKNEKAIKSEVPGIRSKGLGLGADTASKEKFKLSNSKEPQKEEELPLVKGAYVRILQGSYVGHYGEVQGLDETRVLVKLSQEEKIESVLIPLVEVVSKKEFKKESKVLNRSTYDEYKKEHESKATSESQQTSKKSDSTRKEESKSKPSGKNSPDLSQVKSSNGEVSYTSSKKAHKRKSRSRSPDYSNKHSVHAEKRSRQPELWVCPQLKVRFIDKQYKKGKYFNQKMTVEDVLSADSCVCTTEDGKYLEDINPKSLETVVPRSEASFVKVVRGKYKGQIGTILKRDKSNCIATVNFLSNREKVTKLDYDSICEYVGDVSQYE